MRELVARALKQDGHEVVANCDGAAALDALLRDGGAFDLLLTDIKMPMMDGIALALAASRDYPALPILLMTGYADQRERASGLELLIRDVIPSRSRWRPSAVRFATHCRCSRCTKRGALRADQKSFSSRSR